MHGEDGPRDKRGGDELKARKMPKRMKWTNGRSGKEEKVKKRLRIINKKRNRKKKGGEGRRKTWQKQQKHNRMLKENAERERKYSETESNI